MYDYGQILKINLDLPDYYEVHFSNTEFSGESTTALGDANGVVIPDTYLASGSDIWAFVFLHTGTEDGETEYKIHIPVVVRPEITEDQPTPEEHSYISDAIAALNDAIGRTSASAAAAAESETNAAASENAAEEAMDAAAGSAQAAAQSAANAAEDARAAGISEANAGQSASDAADSAVDACQSAERAEQAATTAGYLDIDIDPETGRLVYTRTDQVDVTFELREEHLVMEVI